MADQRITVFSSAEAPWWNPPETFSTTTLILQWAILFAILYGLNDFLARRAGSGPLTSAVDSSSSSVEGVEGERVSS